jgi:hypothetical protein
VHSAGQRGGEEEGKEVWKEQHVGDEWRVRIGRMIGNEGRRDLSQIKSKCPTHKEQEGEDDKG